MRKPISLGLRAMVCAVVLVAGGNSPTFAADLTASDGASANFTGISVVPRGQRAQIDPGIPAGYAQLKAAQVASFEAGQIPAKSLARVKTGSGSKTLLLQATISPMVSTCVGTYPCAAGFTSVFPSLHQMRMTYCVVAFSQTVASWDLSTSYRTMGGSQRAAQDAIYQALGSSTINIDKRALTWINQQFTRYGYGFSYVAEYPTSTADFMRMVRADVVLYVETNYVRVDLSSGRYGGFSTGGLHATGTTAYDDNNGIVTSFDPWSLRNNTNGICQSTYYDKNQTSGCVWTMTQANYFLAMDRSGAGTLPVWY